MATLCGSTLLKLCCVWELKPSRRACWLQYCTVELELRTETQTLLLGQIAAAAGCSNPSDSASRFRASAVVVRIVPRLDWEFLEQCLEYLP